MDGDCARLPEAQNNENASHCSHRRCLFPSIACLVNNGTKRDKEALSVHFRVAARSPRNTPSVTPALAAASNLNNTFLFGATRRFLLTSYSTRRTPGWYKSICPYLLKLRTRCITINMPILDGYYVAVTDRTGRELDHYNIMHEGSNALSCYIASEEGMVRVLNINYSCIYLLLTDLVYVRRNSRSSTTTNLTTDGPFKSLSLSMGSSWLAGMQILEVV